MSSSHSSKIAELERKLRQIDEEKKSLEAELSALRSTTATQPPELTTPLLGTQTAATVPTTVPEKLELFLKLFRCRESVYPKLWENKSKGSKGYSPACSNEWVRGVCGKPPHGKVKCSECPNPAFPKLDAVAVESHLKGQITIGTYAIREDDTCAFLACDFDGTGWQSDAFVYQAVAKEMGVDVLVERSRSGNGAHAWLFFNEPVPARLARALGTIILSRCGEVHHRFGLESYDRFFPNQDYLPKGGFGNLIALPLQRFPRESGNSVFIGADVLPLPDQWSVLAGVRRLSLSELRSLLDRFVPNRSVKSQSSDEDVSQTLDSKVLDSNSDLANALVPGTVLSVTRGDQIAIPLDGLPSKLVTRLKRIASFPNPEFYKLQRMRMQTYPHPRFIFSGELRADELLLPRGVLEKVTEALSQAGATVVVQDERSKGKRLPLDFLGTLTPVQEEAISALKKHDQGVLVAPPGVGKTVMACALIGKRKVSTLVLVHRQPIMDQWKESIGKFLGMNPKEIGMLGGTKKKRTGKLDIVMLQTLTKAKDLEEIIADYGQIIIDECHHIPATSFEAMLKLFPAKYILGLTATPNRKDGLEKILFHQCGPIRHEIKSADGGKLGKKVTIRETGFRLPDEVGAKPSYHVIAHLITTDPRRNRMIVSDIGAALKAKRFPLVISDRKDQLEALQSSLMESLNAPDSGLSGLRTFRLEGGMSSKERRTILEQITASREESVPTVVFSTASLIGEGFDMPELDALVLATPLSFEGRMVQYAGRLHRLADGKENVVIYDYVDSYCAVSIKMYRNRIKAYRKMGYEIVEPDHFFGGKSMRQDHLFLQ